MCPPDTPIHRSNLLGNTPCRLPQWSDKNKRRRNQAVEGWTRAELNRKGRTPLVSSQRRCAAVGSSRKRVERCQDRIREGTSPKPTARLALNQPRPYRLINTLKTASRITNSSTGLSAIWDYNTLKFEECMNRYSKNQFLEEHNLITY